MDWIRNACAHNQHTRTVCVRPPKMCAPCTIQTPWRAHSSLTPRMLEFTVDSITLSERAFAPSSSTSADPDPGDSGVLPSSPYVSSVCFCIGISRRMSTDTKPAAENPIIAFHTTARLSANASRTSVRVGSWRLGMAGMAAYAISMPAGNCSMNAGGRRFFSSFCRMLAEMVTPHV